MTELLAGRVGDGAGVFEGFWGLLGLVAGGLVGGNGSTYSFFPVPFLCFCRACSP